MPALPLEGQRAVVTGASSGIGRACALALAEAGAAVIVNYRKDEAGAQAAAGEIAAAGGTAHVVQADVGREADVERLLDEARQRLGGIDILIANAGLQRDAAIADMTLDDWRAVIDVNLTGQFLCAQAAVRQFRAQGRGAASTALGKIVFMNSVHQHIPWAGHVNYAASKGGLKLLMESLAQELAPEGVRVNAVAPGAIATSINAAVWQDPTQKEALLKLIPYGRIGAAEDVARAVVWLASDASDYVVGTTLVIDGGMSLYPGFQNNG